MAIKPKYEIKNLFGTGDLITSSSMNDLIDASYNPTLIPGDNIQISTVNTASGSEITINATVDGYDTPAEVRAAVQAADNSNVFTDANLAKLNGIEARADVTDVANVTTALNSISVTALSDVTAAGSGSIISGDERTKLTGIEAGADVTDVTNVTTALNSISVTELSDVSETSGTITFSTILISGGSGLQLSTNPDRIYYDGSAIAIAPNDSDVLFISDTTGVTVNGDLRGNSANSLAIKNVGTIAGGTGDPSIRFENDYDVYLGDADEADTATRIHIDAGNEFIAFETAGFVKLPNDVRGGSARSLELKNVGRIYNTTGDPSVKFTNSYDIAIGDVDEAGNGTRVEISDGDETIEINGDLQGPSTNSLLIKNINSLFTATSYPNISFFSGYGNLALGDAEDVDTGTRVEISNTNETIDMYGDVTSNNSFTAAQGVSVTGGTLAVSVATISFSSLPTTDPGVAGRLYRDASGFVKVSL